MPLRFFQGLFVAFGVSTLTFVLLMAMPGDLAVKVTMARYGEDGLSNERIEMVRPIPVWTALPCGFTANGWGTPSPLIWDIP